MVFKRRAEDLATRGGARGAKATAHEQRLDIVGKAFQGSISTIISHVLVLLKSSSSLYKALGVFSESGERARGGTTACQWYIDIA